MDEIDNIAYAKAFIDSLAKGINPLDGSNVPENEVVNNVRISRCLFYVSDILGKVIENGGVSRGKKQKKPPFFLSPEKRESFAFSKTPITVSEIAKRINALNEAEICNKLKYSDVTEWLIKGGLLKTVETGSGKTVKRPTGAGMEAGIITEERQNMYGKYVVVEYTEAAQRLILDNLDEITETNNGADKKTEDEYMWHADADEKLVETYIRSASVRKAAAAVGCSEKDAENRLKKLHFME